MHFGQRTMYLDLYATLQQLQLLRLLQLLQLMVKASVISPFYVPIIYYLLIVSELISCYVLLSRVHPKSPLITANQGHQSK